MKGLEIFDTGVCIGPFFYHLNSKHIALPAGYYINVAAICRFATCFIFYAHTHPHPYIVSSTYNVQIYDCHECPQMHGDAHGGYLSQERVRIFELSAGLQYAH